MEKDAQTKADSENGDARKSTSWMQVCQGVLAGLIGVQSQKNRERDFKMGNGVDYILVYTLMVVAMVLGMVVVVNLVIP
ncbi:DUF2970 domain-containing protein [Alcanivorax jadensis]|uniref:DUF2970 domain-containing protein n=1 Tax=Alcanivorax jadensis TaxID=64988 RepID=UPI002409732A|nr:DUF2970 domain-containing protein [Alcanivorax jadensis]MDF1639061.1 DUF2970 domain-containing protein [Alcanivorax jadensis]